MGSGYVAARNAAGRIMSSLLGVPVSTPGGAPRAEIPGQRFVALAVVWFPVSRLDA